MQTMNKISQKATSQTTPKTTKQKNAVVIQWDDRRSVGVSTSIFSIQPLFLLPSLHLELKGLNGKILCGLFTLLCDDVCRTSRFVSAVWDIKYEANDALPGCQIHWIQVAVHSEHFFALHPLDSSSVTLWHQCEISSAENSFPWQTKNTRVQHFFPVA